MKDNFAYMCNTNNLSQWTGKTQWKQLLNSVGEMMVTKEREGEFWVMRRRDHFDRMIVVGYSENLCTVKSVKSKHSERIVYQ